MIETKNFFKNPIFYIISFSFIFIFFLIYFFSSPRTVSHDAIWCYGLIDYFFTFLSKGVFPYWDIYNYSGQPFFYNIGITRIYEPQTILLVLANKFVGLSFLTLYHVDFILKLIITAFGVYMCYGQINRYSFSNVLTYIVFLTSSFTFLSMWQPGFLTGFMWTPYIVYFFFRLNRENNLLNVIGFSLFLGISMASYQAGYVLTFMFFMILLFPKKTLKEIFKSRINLVYLVISIFIFSALSLHVFSLYPERNKVTAVIRAIGTDSAKKEEFKYTTGGVSGKPVDIFELIKPRVLDRGFRYEINKNVSEDFVSIGFFAFLLVLLGLFFGKGTLRWRFLLLAILILFLMLDGRVIFGRYANYIFPFLRFSKHMQLFQPFLIFCLMYFVGQGSDFLVDVYLQKNKSKNVYKS